MRFNPFRKSQSKASILPLRFGDQELDNLHQRSERAQARFGKHLEYIEPIQLWYKRHDADPNARQNAIEACERQIALSREAIAAWHEWGRLNGEMLQYLGDRSPRKPWGIPSHTGFAQLAIIREKDGDYAEAIRLCKQAKCDGWAGDRDKRIARLEQKQSR